MGEERGVYKVLVGKPEGKRLSVPLDVQTDTGTRPALYTSPVVPWLLSGGKAASA